MGAITNSNVASAIVKLVAADALPVLVGNLVMGNLVNRDYEPVLANAGDTVNVPIPPTMVANNIAAGGTVTPQNPSLGNAPEHRFRIESHGYAVAASGGLRRSREVRSPARGHGACDKRPRRAG